MALKMSYELHHHFPKIAEESGFTFNNYRPRVQLNWNKIRLIDIENLIRERKFEIIEQHLNDILGCVLESEFDVRILDEGVLKLFRLAQLAVEYQQFCRQYLDRSVYILRQEITTMAQDLESTKKNLAEKEDELRKLRKRTRYTYKTPLPYGNDNIANMILNTLSNRAELFPSTSNLDSHQYNKCKYCDKVFLNQLYLKSHIERRHANLIELPQKEIDRDPNQKFNLEIIELKNKLKEMEEMISSANKKTASMSLINNDVETKCTNIIEADQNQTRPNTQTIAKDSEVSTNNDEYLINKLEEWKKEEQEKHTKEITKLKTELLETINSFKEKEEKSPAKTNSESNIIEQLHATIKQQGVEILTLKEELNICKMKSEKDSAEKYQKTASRVAFWIQKAETQAKQYESLLEKLNDIAKDAKESRGLAEAERERANKLEAIVKQVRNQKEKENMLPTEITPGSAQNTDIIPNDAVREHSPKNSNVTFKRDSLEQLHKRAQELLNIGSISSTSTDISSIENIRTISPKKPQPVKIQEKIINRHKFIQNNETNFEENNTEQIQSLSANEINKLPTKQVRHKKEKSRSHVKMVKEVKTPLYVPESPLKIVRAKLTEEVNNRLILASVDPLKRRLSQSVFRKQRAQLQQQQELKSKKNPSIDKVRNAILAYLDENTSSIRSESNHIDIHVPSRSTSKPFRSFTSVIENVKSKALSLVKGNDMGVVKEKRKSWGVDVSRKAMALLKTPPGSTSTSPQTIKSPIRIIPVTEVPKNAKNKIKHIKSLSIHSEEGTDSNVGDTEISNESDNKYHNTSVVQISSKSMDNLLKSPARRPASASPMKNLVKNYTITDDNETHLIRSHSATQLNSQNNTESINSELQKQDSSRNERVIPELEVPLAKANSEETVQNIKLTKSVLKNASSTSSLNKKKVIFDMDAIQMKSLSASPSQSITEKSDNNHKYELGLVNLDTEEWDISSIDSDPLENDTRIRFSTQTAPKIAELKKKIESQLARRNETPNALVGSVDVLGGSLTKAPSTGGSNTSLGSSILDESVSAPVPSPRTIIKPKRIIAKNDSHLDISELSIENLDNKNESF